MRTALRGQGRRLGLLVLPWMLLLLVGSPMLWWEMDRAMQAPVLRDRDDTLHEATQVVVRTLYRLHRDVRFLADLPKAMMREEVGPDSMAVALLTSFSASAADYDQVRWIDQLGYERLRIDHRNGGPRWVPAEALQYKGDRPYFRDSAGLAPGEVYFSEFDLNIENGVIERPLQPMLRVASPVREGEAGRGVVVINYRASVLLERLRHLGDRQGLAVYLVNRDGYWIEGPTEAHNWGWQLQRPDRTLARSHPGLWRAMQAAHDGEWRDASGNWAFTRLSRDSLTAAMEGAAVDWEALDLRVLVHVDPKHANAFSWRWKALLASLLLLAALVALMMVLWLVRSMAREANHVRELSRANEALTIANQRLRAMQEELARVERLSSLGLMVAGVAHEMNTPLGSATLALSTVQRSVAGLRSRMVQGLRRSDLDAHLAHCDSALALAEAELQRAVGLVQRFKQVAVDRTTLERRRFDLAEAIRDADPRLRRWDAGHAVQLQLDLADAVTLDSYPGPLQQVVSNLLNNALAHGFEEGAQGWIRITSEADGADAVVVRVEDNGKGIPAAALPRIFEPFFTTRRGKGNTGLGLHIVHQLVTEVLGGTVKVRSPAQPGGHGTCFELRLPRSGPARRGGGED